MSVSVSLTVETGSLEASLVYASYTPEFKSMYSYSPEGSLSPGKRNVMSLIGQSNSDVTQRLSSVPPLPQRVWKSGHGSVSL